MEIKRGGLLPNPKDDRDIRVFDAPLGSGIYRQPRIEDLPTNFLLDPIFQYNQGEDDCSANATGGAKSIQDGKKLHAPSLFGFSKLISGDPEAWGQTHRNILKAITKFGAIFEDELPLDLVSKDLKWWRDPQNWADRADELFRLAAKNRAASFMAITGRYDAFDNIKTAIWAFQQQKRSITFGLLWAHDAYNPLVDVTDQEGFGHLVHLPGWTIRDGKEVLILQNSWGPDVGENGRFYVTREEVNKMADIYGIYMLEDLPAEVAKYYQENGASIEDNWTILQLKAFQTALVDALKKLVGILTGKVEKTGAPVPSKWLIPALIWQESGGDDWAIGDKHLKDKAYGCLQIRRPCLIDVKQIRRVPATVMPEHLLGNRVLSIAVFRAYMDRYAKVELVGKPITDEIMARCWNGGPTGWKRNTTVMYWYQVKKKMELLESGKVDPVLLAKITRTV